MIMMTRGTHAHRVLTRNDIGAQYIKVLNVAGSFVQCYYVLDSPGICWRDWWLSCIFKAFLDDQSSRSYMASHYISLEWPCFSFFKNSTYDYFYSPKFLDNEAATTYISSALDMIIFIISLEKGCIKLCVVLYCLMPRLPWKLAYNHATISMISP